MNEQLWWHVSRATGVVAWGLLAISVLWGLFVSARLVKKKGVPAWSTEVHRFAAALAVVFTLGHLGSLIADNYIHFTLKDLVVPFASEYKTGPIAWAWWRCGSSRPSRSPRCCETAYLESCGGEPTPSPFRSSLRRRFIRRWRERMPKTRRWSSPTWGSSSCPPGS